MNFTYITWITIFGLYLLFCTSTSEGTQKVEAVDMYSNETTVNEEKTDGFKYIFPLAATMSMLAIPILCGLAWLVYIKFFSKKPHIDVENPPVAAETTTTEMPESTDSFLRRLWRRIRQKMTKEKPKDIDVENPPETTPPEQKSKAAILFDRTLSEKCKIKKQKDTVDKIEKLPDVPQTEEKAKVETIEKLPDVPQTKKKLKIAK
ncbi:hypothetical protein XELAEV_18031875mg, partial [Xenopus laevis]